MNKVTCSITMSLDAFVAGPNQSFEKPFGDIPENLLHHWMFDEPEKHQAELDALVDAGAFIMGSNMFGPKEKRGSTDWIPDIELEPFEISGTKLVTHIRYRVVKK